MDVDMKIDRKNVWKYIFSCLISLCLLSSCDTHPKFYLTSSSPPASALYDSALNLTKAKAYEEAMIFLDSASRISETTKDSLSLGTIYHLMGFVKRRLGKEDQALIDYYRALELFEKVDNIQTIGQILNSIGRVYEENNEPEKALQNYLNAYELLKEQEKTAAIILTNIGYVYKKKRVYDKAMESFYAVLKLETTASNISEKAKQLVNIALVYKLKGEYQEAEENFRQALNIFEEQDDKRRIAHTLNNLALVYTESHQRDKAIDYFKRSIAIKEEINDRTLLNGYNNLAELYLKEGTTSLANQYLDKALSLKDNMSFEEHFRVIQLKAEISENLGQLQQALDYIKEGNVLKDSVFNEKLAIKTTELQNQALMEKVEEKIHLIKIERENALKDSLLESKDRFIQWVSSSSIAVIIFLVVLFFLYRRLRVVNVTLNNLIEDGAHTMSNQLQGVECGAIELKHGPVPLAPPQVRSVTLIENSSKAMRRLIDSFTGTKDKTKIVTKIHRPENSIDQILELYRGMAMTREMKIETVIESEAMILVKPEEYEHAIGNLVSNAIKYAPEKSTITIHLYDKEEEVYLAVLDEGEGIPADKQHKLFKKRMKLHRKKGIVSNGLGLYFAKKNIKAMNGKLWYEDRPGGGAAFIIAFFKADGA